MERRLGFAFFLTNLEEAMVKLITLINRCQ